MTEAERQTLARTDSENPYRIESNGTDASVYRISTSLWAGAILADGLMGFDPAIGGEEEATLLGFYSRE